MNRSWNTKRIVVKIGTSALTKSDGTLNRGYMQHVARQISELITQGKTVTIVSSGAIVSGVKELGIRAMPKDIPSRQAAASVGQGILMDAWRDAFRRYGVQVAQILLTYEAFSNRRTYVNLRNSMTVLARRKAVPIINENDTISVHEIEKTFGDNDKLSAMVASNTHAELLIVLTDVNGLYTKNPRFPDAKLITEVPEISRQIENFAGEARSWRSKGGMKSKIEAARIATMSNCSMVIANARKHDVILRAVRGERVGTFFKPIQIPSSSKRRWIRHVSSSGAINVDHQAARLLFKGNSLPPSALQHVEGDFDAGSVVSICLEGTEFAKGVIDYSSEELNRIKGTHASKIERILGYKNYSTVVRKENVIFTKEHGEY